MTEDAIMLICILLYFVVQMYIVATSITVAESIKTRKMNNNVCEQCGMEYTKEEIEICHHCNNCGLEMTKTGI